MPTLGILGAGSMGAGIAQVAATSGWQVLLADVDSDAVNAARERIGKHLARGVEKGRMTQEEADATMANVVASKSSDLESSNLFIEAIVEDMDIKVNAMSPIAASLPSDSIIATNTSSLSVSEIGRRIGEPHRTCGMHFFNPAPIMKLVEVVRGDETHPDVLNRADDVASAWGKQVARCADTPGFIVNRIARPYYLEGFRCFEDGFAGAADIDKAMKGIGGFRMGPLELTDFIGHDVNAATTRSIWEQWSRPARLTPSAVQEGLVAAGALGRKAGCGVYDWSGETPTVVLEPPNTLCELSGDLITLADAFCDAAAAEAMDETWAPQQRFAFTRILSAVLNEADWANRDGVAEPVDIDVAMQAGVNYPRGPFKWRAQIGEARVRDTLDALESLFGDGRFARP
ncbi:MAG: 3-hydroxyacyl-CoA dehydrogenase NAD-binding domain-containing protein [Phycisphaerales bacterium]|jgi:3-hydroxybutyryl-CoA dehydrogenase|nr:3-hydroxyacyl-CoA dehydrogenase NAD-binding domain-containing protein [Phycisphaerales bacterium]